MTGGGCLIAGDVVRQWQVGGTESMEQSTGSKIDR